MKKNIEITVFTEGDSNLLKTWSNVPYFFTQTLIDQGYRVNRIDISRWNFIKKLYNHTFSKIINIFFPLHAYQFERTGLYNNLVEKKIKKYIQNDQNSDLYVFMTYTFYNKWNKIPSLLFSDWSYDYYIKDRCKRQPYFFEKKYLRKQLKSFRQAELVISLFKGCADYIKGQVPKANVHFLGGNVINSFYKGNLDVEKLISDKKSKIRLLFIGMQKYREGAELLIESFSLLKEKYKDAELHIVGMENICFSSLPEGVFCYGYLHKDVPDECELYYELLKKATLFVNPTREWAGYSSTIEAMYFYTPVIISPYKEFIEEFGENIDFGLYNREYDKICLLRNIEQILISKEYNAICAKAHKKVESYTWDSYMKRVMNQIGFVK